MMRFNDSEPEVLFCDICKAEFYFAVEKTLNAAISMHENLNLAKTAAWIRKEKDTILADPQRVLHEYKAIIAVRNAMKSV